MPDRPPTTPLKHRQRCYTCYRPVDRCFCELIPTIDNRTEVLILQHVKERFHAFNTARIVNQALHRCQLLVDQTDRLGQRDLPLTSGSALLYPGPEAQLLSDLPVRQHPRQLVVLDGTWHHAKTLLQQIPLLQTLPRVRLQPTAPSTYRIRREPTDTAISTLEAVVQALSMLEPETAGLDLLLNAFDGMIDGQVSHPRQRLPRHRKRSGREFSNIPRALLHTKAAHIVVAYGEATHPRHARHRPRLPVSWVAQRLDSSDPFECFLTSDAWKEPGFTECLQLETNPEDTAVSVEEFRQRWAQFRRPDDVLVVYNSGTRELLAAADIATSSSLLLKSIHIPQAGATLADTLDNLNLTGVPVPHQGRSGTRLGNALAYTHYLRQLVSQNGESKN